MAAVILAGHVSKLQLSMPLSFKRGGLNIAIDMFDPPHIMKILRNGWVNQVRFD